MTSDLAQKAIARAEAKAAEVARQRTADQAQAERLRAAAAAASVEIDDEDRARAERERVKRQQAHNARMFGKGLQYALFGDEQSPAFENQWSPQVIAQVDTYVELALSPKDHVLPVLDPAVAKIVQSMFRYGIQLAAKQGKPVPADLLCGQRQPWFKESPKVPATQLQQQKIVIKAAPVIFDRPAKPKSVAAAAQPVEADRPAITLRPKKSRRRVHQSA